MCVCVCVCVFAGTTGVVLGGKTPNSDSLPKKQGVLFVCLSLPGGMYFTRHTSFLLASHWIPAGGHWGAATYRASVTNEGESVPHHIEK